MRCQQQKAMTKKDGAAKHVNDHDGEAGRCMHVLSNNRNGWPSPNFNGPHPHEQAQNCVLVGRGQSRYLVVGLTICEQVSRIIRDFDFGSYTF